MNGSRVLLTLLFLEILIYRVFSHQWQGAQNKKIQKKNTRASRKVASSHQRSSESGFAAELINELRAKFPKLNFPEIKSTDDLNWI